MPIDEHRSVYSLFATAILVINAPIKNIFDKNFKQYFVFFLALLLVVFVFNPIYLFYSSVETFGQNASGLFSSLVIKDMFVGVVAGFLIYLIFYPIRYFLLILITAIFFIVYLYSYVFVLDLGIFRADGFTNAIKITNFGGAYISLEVVGIILFFVVLYRYFHRVSKYLFITTVSLLVFHIFDCGAFVENYNKTTLDIASKTKNTISKNIDEPEIGFSKKEKNVLIVLLDAFAGWKFQNLVDNYPDLNSKLDGFVWYKNTVSNGTFTMVSMPAMLAGNGYTMDKVNKKDKNKLFDIYDYAWSYIPNNFSGFDVQYMGVHYVAGKTIKKLLKKGVDILDENLLAKRFYGEKEELDFINYEYLHAASLFKSAPIFLKKKMYKKKYLREKLSSNLHRYKKSIALFDFLKNNVSSNLSKPAVKYFWFSETIRPSFMNEKCEYAEYESGFNGDGEKEADYTMNCYLNALNDMFEEMKKQGVYDNTKIILTSDHGSYGRASMWHDYSIFAFLAVKEFGKRHSLQTSNKAMMNSDTIAIACKDVAQCVGNEEDPRVNNNQKRKRVFNVTTHGNQDSLEEKVLPLIYRIEVVGDVYDRNNWNKL
jgi:hypothetical protein